MSGPSRSLAFNYLEELLKEFQSKYQDEVESASRPYAFIKFGTPPCGKLMCAMETQYASAHADTFIQRTKKLYVDTRTQRNLNKLNDVCRRRADIARAHN